LDKLLSIVNSKIQDSITEPTNNDNNEVQSQETPILSQTEITNKDLQEKIKSLVEENSTNSLNLQSLDEVNKKQKDEMDVLKEKNLQLSDQLKNQAKQLQDMKDNMENIASIQKQKENILVELQQARQQLKEVETMRT